jgi:hypothetical protein
MLRRGSLLALPLAALGTGSACAEAPAPRGTPIGIWIGAAEIRALPTSGPAWQALLAEAEEPLTAPNLSDQDDLADTRVLAKALAYARTGDERYRREVIAAVAAAQGTERGGRVLALARNLLGYVVAADLVGLPASEDRAFRAWLDGVRSAELDGATLVSTHEKRPNNWGTHAGASRLAAALYLGDREDLCRAARVFRGWLGDRSAYAGFRFGEDRSWHADPGRPVGVNPAGATRDGHSIDGVMPDDQRRAGPFAWPPPTTNYAYGALQGALAQAVILDRQGFDVWQWQDQALRRAFAWLHDEARFPARDDDTWQPHLVNQAYGTSFPAPLPTRPGKNVGFTDWTHAGRALAAGRPSAPCPLEGGGR